jgi:hypothetical protein
MNIYPIPENQIRLDVDASSGSDLPYGHSEEPTQSIGAFANSFTLILMSFLPILWFLAQETPTH